MCIALIALVDPALATSTELQFSVSRDVARCVVKNRQKYEKIAKDPAIIFLKLCPTVDPSLEQISRLNQATGSILIKELPPGTPRPPRTVVALTRRQLTCFLEQLTVGDSFASRTRTASVAVDLAKCR